MGAARVSILFDLFNLDLLYRNLPSQDLACWLQLESALPVSKWYLKVNILPLDWI